MKQYPPPAASSGEATAATTGQYPPTGSNMLRQWPPPASSGAAAASAGQYPPPTGQYPPPPTSATHSPAMVGEKRPRSEYQTSVPPPPPGATTGGTYSAALPSGPPPCFPPPRLSALPAKAPSPPPLPILGAPPPPEKKTAQEKSAKRSEVANNIASFINRLKTSQVPGAKRRRTVISKTANQPTEVRTVFITNIDKYPSCLEVEQFINNSIRDNGITTDHIESLQFPHSDYHGTPVNPGYLFIVMKRREHVHRILEIFSGRLFGSKHLRACIYSDKNQWFRVTDPSTMEAGHE